MATLLTRMSETIDLLSGNFSILDLGSANASGLPGLKQFRKAAILIEIDALANSQTRTSDYYKKIAIRGAVSGARERRVFFRRKFSQASSCLEIDPQRITDYGLQALLEVEEQVELECETLQSLLAAHGIARVDFLKTDLEGLDFDVLIGSPDVTARSLVIQSELRFQPLYVGEPHFHTIAAYLTDLGFELITIRPEAWKYPTPNSHLTRDGRLVWADVVFFLNMDRVKRLFQEEASLAFIKQVILAKSLGLHNYAEHLFENVKGLLPPAVQVELREYLKLSVGLQLLLIRAANGIWAVPGGGRFLTIIRRGLSFALKTLPVSKSLKHIASFY